MKKTRDKKPAGDEMRPEYDLRGGVRGKYYERYKQGSNVVLLEPPTSTDGHKGIIKRTVSASMFHRLGDELIRDPQTAFCELVKNSFDADATEVHISFRKTRTKDGTISIRDNGTGMTKEDVETKWGRAGGENKARDRYSPKFTRPRLGAKGIGRFSLSKLGNSVKVITRPPGNPLQFVFSENYANFTDDKDFDEMDISYKEGSPRKGFDCGTILEISELREADRWGKREIKKVQNILRHLIAAERKDQNFRILFNCSDYSDLTGPLANPITGQESHRIDFSVDRHGAYVCETKVNGKSNSKEKEQREAPSYGPVEGVIKYYQQGLKREDRTLAGGSEEESHMGIKVYRDNCRVLPYGGESDDWLQMKEKKARAGGKYYVTPRYAAGSIYISTNDNPDLKDATNREAGIIGNSTFETFQVFVQSHVDRLNNLLEQESRSESQKQKLQTVKKILDTAVKCLNRQKSEVYGDYVERLDRSKKGMSGETSENQESVVIDVKPRSKEEWSCNDCEARWRVLRGTTPSACMEFAVSRSGDFRDAEGCGSQDIGRAKHDTANPSASPLTSIVSGEYALIEGRRLKVRVDEDMGENEDEFLFDAREIVVNGNHPAYNLAAKLDRVERYEIGLFVPALTVHITKCVCLAWAELHFKETKNWNDFKDRYDELRDSICEAVGQESGFKKPAR